jgi:hypothetical protein
MKLGSPAVKNGSPGLRASAIFNPIFQINIKEPPKVKLKVTPNQI